MDVDNITSINNITIISKKKHTGTYLILFFLYYWLKYLWKYFLKAMDIIFISESFSLNYIFLSQKANKQTNKIKQAKKIFWSHDNAGLNKLFLVDPENFIKDLTFAVNIVSSNAFTLYQELIFSYYHYEQMNPHQLQKIMTVLLNYSQVMKILDRNRIQYNNQYIHIYLNDHF